MKGHYIIIGSRTVRTMNQRLLPDVRSVFRISLTVDQGRSTASCQITTVLMAFLTNCMNKS